MSHPALIDELRRKARLEAETVWQKARSDAETARAAAARAIEDARTRHARNLSNVASEAGQSAIAEAESRARQIRAASKAVLAVRLHGCALDALQHFRDEAYPELFAALARELPSSQWVRVVVNPGDQSLARIHFPQAQIVCDAAIAGGMVVEGGGMRISNTLETRLEAAWPDLLAGVMKDAQANP